MYSSFQAFLQLYSAQAPINSVYKHIHFFYFTGTGCVSTQARGCAQHVLIIISKIVTLKRYIKSKNNIARLR